MQCELSAVRVLSGEKKCHAYPSRGAHNAHCLVYASDSTAIHVTMYVIPTGITWRNFQDKPSVCTSGGKVKGIVCSIVALCFQTRGVHWLFAFSNSIPKWMQTQMDTTCTA